MSPKRDDTRFIERMEMAHMKHHFRTNDVVRVTGLQSPRVNGKALDLSTHGLTLFLLLAERAKAAEGDFVSSDDIIKALQAGQRVLGHMKMSWDSPSKAAIYTAVSDLRRVLRKSRLNENLIELANGKGYRLSTPAMNIIIDVPGAGELARLTMRPFDGDSDDEPTGYRPRLRSP